MQNPEQSSECVGDDILVGASAIATELKMAESQVHYLFRKKLLPIGKLGGQYIASRSKLRRAVRDLTSTTAA